MPETTLVTDIFYQVSQLVNNKDKYVPDEYLKQCRELFIEIEKKLKDEDSYNLSSKELRLFKKLVKSLV